MLTPLAEWSSLTRVWSVAHFDDEDNPEDQISPLDVVLAWGEAGLPSVYGQLDFRHGGRWYHFEAPAPGLGLPSVRDISRHSSNVHLIPSDDTVRAALARVRANDVVRLQGWLVRAQRPNWVWRSSLRRTDTGQGACELLFVREVDVFEATTPLPVGT